MKLQFDHAALVVPDIAEAIAWYSSVLCGASVLYQDKTWALLDANGVRLAFVVKEQHPSHLAWRVSSVDLETLAAEHSKTIKTHRDGSRSFYLEAPGSSWIEIIDMGEHDESGR